MKEIISKAEQLHHEDRRQLILKLLRMQRHELTDAVPLRENCTLIDLSTGIIAGSGICPLCEGFMGRQDDYVE